MTFPAARTADGVKKAEAALPSSLSRPSAGSVDRARRRDMVQIDQLVPAVGGTKRSLGVSRRTVSMSSACRRGAVAMSSVCDSELGRLVLEAERLAEAGRIEAAERLLRAAADDDRLAARAAIFRVLVRLCLHAGRPASAAVWNQQAIAAASLADPPDLLLGAAVAAALDTATERRSPAVRAPSTDGSGVVRGRLVRAAAWFAGIANWDAADAALGLCVSRDTRPADRRSDRRLRAQIAGLALSGNGPRVRPLDAAADPGFRPAGIASRMAWWRRAVRLKEGAVFSGDVSPPCARKNRLGRGDRAGDAHRPRLPFTARSGGSRSSRCTS